MTFRRESFTPIPTRRTLARHLATAAPDFCKSSTSGNRLHRQNTVRRDTAICATRPDFFPRLVSSESDRRVTVGGRESCPLSGVHSSQANAVCRSQSKPSRKHQCLHKSYRHAMPRRYQQNTLVSQPCNVANTIYHSRTVRLRSFFAIP